MSELEGRAEQKTGHLGRRSEDHPDNFGSVTSSAKFCPFCDSLEWQLPYLCVCVATTQRKTGSEWWEGWVEILLSCLWLLSWLQVGKYSRGS